MRKENMNFGWKYWPKGEESSVKAVDLPHDAMIHRRRIKKLKNGSYTGFYPSGDYVYTKTLFGEERYAEKKLVLEYEGVYMDSKVSVNGEFIGGHVYGYSHFYVDVTDHIRIGQDNEIRVDVHSGQVPNARWYPGNGIYRPVHLWVSEKEHIKLDGVYIHTLSINPAVVEVATEAEAGSDTQIFVEFWHDGARIVAGQGAKVQLTVPNAKLWDAEHPNLYTAVVKLCRGDTVLDTAEETFGIRTLDWSAENGLRVNGEEVKLRGGCVHSDNGTLGACSFRSAEYRKVRIMKDAGFNAIRSAHNPISKYMLQACDELGMYIMDEAFDTWRDSNGMYGYPLHFEYCWKDDLAKMVLKDRNHPSVLIYSIGNEISDTARPEGAELAGEMTGICHSLDLSRPVCVCPNLFMNIMQNLGLKLSLGGGNAPSLDDVTDPLEESAEDSELGGSAAINVLMMTGPLLMKALMRPRLSEKGSGLTFSKVDIAGYNYGEQVYQAHHKMVPDRIIVGSETHPPTIKRNWDLVMSSPAIIGDFMWTGWDYLGEVGVGRIEYGENTGVYIKPYPSVSAYTGAINLIGDRDLYSYLAAIVWGTEKQPYIAVERLNHIGEKKHESHYRFSDAIPCWTWPGQEGKKGTVEVYSTGTSVELLQDGKSLGKKKLKDCVAKFKTVYAPGKLEAISYDASGKEIARSELRTADAETKLTVEVENPTIPADGEALAYINVSITDNHGNLKMMDNRMISAEVSGAGVLQAVGSGSPLPEEAYDGNCCTTYQGRMQIVVRSGHTPGNIRIHISNPELGEKTVKVTVQ